MTTKGLIIATCVLLAPAAFAAKGPKLPVGMKAAVANAVRANLAARGITPPRIDVLVNDSELNPKKITSDGPHTGRSEYMFYWRAGGESGVIHTIPVVQRNKLYLVGTSISNVGAGIGWSK